eukprot:s2583_g1.t1
MTLICSRSTEKMVELPSQTRGQDMGAGASSSRLQHATQVLQAALANWEVMTPVGTVVQWPVAYAILACMQGDEARGSRCH